jgi:type VI protein secretion system component VasK
MSPMLLDDVSFWDVVWWMIMVFFFVMAIWVFISIFADILRRNDHSGWAKAGWMLFIFVLPLIGCLVYIIARPRMTAQDQQMIAQYQEVVHRQQAFAADEVAKAQKLKESGAITAEEFEKIKKRYVG